MILANGKTIEQQPDHGWRSISVGKPIKTGKERFALYIHRGSCFGIGVTTRDTNMSTHMHGNNNTAWSLWYDGLLRWKQGDCKKTKHTWAQILRAGDTVVTEVDKNIGAVSFFVNDVLEASLPGISQELEVFFTVSVMSQSLWGEPTIHPCKMTLVEEDP